MATLVQALAQACAEVTFDDLDEAVRTDVPRRVLDIVGLALAATELDTTASAVAVATEAGGTPQATAIGVPGTRLPAAWAAFVNGVGAHSLDYDDTHLPSILHPSASVVPAALAAAQAHGRTGAETIAAVTAGLEVCVRVGMAGYDAETGQSTFFEHGQHATSICGALGSAVAAAKLAGLDADGIAHAMGIAASMGSGIIEANRTGGTVKRMHCGWAAHAGVTAAALARHGITGPPTALEGRFGFFEAWLHGKFDPTPITEGLGKEWVAPNIHIKPYPANHFTHCGIDAAVELREVHGVTPERVERLTLGVAAPTVRTIGEPIETKRRPATGYQAQFSGPFTVAAALVGGGGLALALDDFSDARANDTALQFLMDKVDVVADERCGEIYPAELPATLTARLTDGTEIVVDVHANRGGPQRPLTAAELRTKFTDNAARVLPGDAVAAIADAADALAGADSLDALLDPTDHLLDPRS